VSVKKKGGVWRGENFADLAAYLRAFKAGGYDVIHAREFTCGACRGTAFRVATDEDGQLAIAVCVGCQHEWAVADSGDQLDDETELGLCQCPCGGDTFAVAVGYAMVSATEVKWISVGLRCLRSGRLGVYVDWKIDYEPSGHLLPNA
jgi:hypothetical protein